MRLDSQQEREYYIQETAIGNWSVSVLERNIKSGYYRRLLSSQKQPKRKKDALTIVNTALNSL
jgi:predicted nuclease of restriction endonuclease-like (RecB) superfamily